MTGVPPSSLPAGRVELRAMVDDDWRLEQELSRDPDVTRWTSYPVDMSEQVSRKRIAAGVARRDRGLAARYVIVVDGHPVGTCGIAHLDVVPEVFYALLADQRGHGFATDAVIALTEWAHAAGYQRVELKTVADNVDSERVAAGAGFRLASTSTGEHQDREVALHRWTHAVVGAVGLDPQVRMRPAAASDGDFLTDLVVAAVNWDPDREPTSRDQILADPRNWHYVEGWVRDGDVGVVAVDGDDVPIGAAWLRMFTADDPGYGFVAADVPELSIGVVEPWRGHGVGRVLLRKALDVAAGHGHGRVTLSVERGNRVRDMYLEEGFVVVGSDSDADTMVKELAASAVTVARGEALRCFRWLDGHADVWAIFESATALTAVLDGLAASWRNAGITAVVGVESRGFLLGAAVADRLGVGFHAVRKDGALFPGVAHTVTSDVDYRGNQPVLSLRGTLTDHDVVLLVDDWAERGSQATAVRNLVEQRGAQWAGLSVIVDQLTDDKRATLGRVASLVTARELGDPDA